MAEVEWLACTDPRPMLASLQGKVSERKLRLFAVACCRQLWHLLPNEQSRSAVEIAERYADGLASLEELSAAFSAVWPAIERRLDDRIIEQGAIPTTREYAGMAAAATAAPASPGMNWVDSWRALPTVASYLKHHPPWEEAAAFALSSAAWDLVKYGVEVPTKKDSTEDVEAWSRAWEQAETRAWEKRRRSWVMVSKRLRGVPWTPEEEAEVEANCRAREDTRDMSEVLMRHAEADARRRQSVLLRDILGNLFRSVQVAAPWLTWNDGVTGHNLLH